MTDRSDAHLIDDIKTVHREAFNELMKRYQEPVYRIAYGFGKNRENALDLTQEIFMKAYHKIDRLDDSDRFLPWLRTLAHHEGINWTRKHKKHAMIEDFDETIHGDIRPQDEDLAMTHRRELVQCLFRLNTRYRLAVVLRYFENMSIREIAVTMQCSEAMVKNLLFRSLSKLRSALNLKQ